MWLSEDVALLNDASFRAGKKLKIHLWYLHHCLNCIIFSCRGTLEKLKRLCKELEKDPYLKHLVYIVKKLIENEIIEILDDDGMYDFYFCFYSFTSSRTEHGSCLFALPVWFDWCSGLFFITPQLNTSFHKDAATVGIQCHYKMLFLLIDTNISILHIIIL